MLTPTEIEARNRIAEALLVECIADGYTIRIHNLRIQITPRQKLLVLSPYGEPPDQPTERPTIETK